MTQRLLNFFFFFLTSQLFNISWLTGWLCPHVCMCAPISLLWLVCWGQGQVVGLGSHFMLRGVKLRPSCFEASATTHGAILLPTHAPKRVLKMRSEIQSRFKRVFDTVCSILISMVCKRQRVNHKHFTLNCLRTQTRDECDNCPRVGCERFLEQCAKLRWYRKSVAWCILHLTVEYGNTGESPFLIANRVGYFVGKELKPEAVRAGGILYSMSSTPA